MRRLHAKTSFMARGRRRAGARTPRYHPACAHGCAARIVAVTGLPVRVYLARRLGPELFFRRLPGDGRIGADASDSSDSVTDGHRGVRLRHGLRRQLDQRERQLLGELLDGVGVEAAGVVPPVQLHKAVGAVRPKLECMPQPRLGAEIGEEDLRQAARRRSSGRSSPPKGCGARRRAPRWRSRGPRTCTTAEPTRCGRRRRRARRPRRSSGRSRGRERRAGFPRPQARDTTARRRARRSACCPEAPRSSEIGGLRSVDGLVVGDTKRAAGKFCNQHGANSSCDVPKMGDLSQKCDTCVNNSNAFRHSIGTAHLRENTLKLSGATYR